MTEPIIISDRKVQRPATGDIGRSNDMPTRRASRWSAIFGSILVGFALLSSLVTFRILTGLTPIEPQKNVIIAVLIVNGLLCLGLMTLILWEIWPLWRARRAGKAAARLHVRLVAMFCGVALVPAIIVAVIASLTLDVGLDRWFSTRTRAIVDNALTVSRAYLREQSQTLRYDIMAISQDINRAGVQPVGTPDPVRLESYLTQQAMMRRLPIVYVLRSDGTLMLQSRVRSSKAYELPSQETIKSAENTSEPVIVTPDTSDLVGAIIKLQAFDGTYLYVARPADPTRLRYLEEAEDASSEYRSMDLRRTGVQIAFGLTYAGITFILLLAAIWFGIAFANRLVGPIRRLIGAADQVSRGNLDVYVPVRASEGDLAHLGHTFNKMTSELKSQRDDLLSANAQVDARRLFTEAVLYGVTAGVIGLNSQFRITLVNRTVLNLLHVEEEEIIGKPLVEVIPELNALLADAQSQQRLVQSEMTLLRGGQERNLLVRVTNEQSAGPEHGYVVTLDDITDLVMAQRSSAWADVARRIAHEIKNPLTPIQLSAERLKRKYGSVITTDREVFDQCTDTIIRQVSDIGRMVDEFSSFARMPKAQIQEEDIGDLVRQVVFLMRVGNPDITFTYKGPDTMLRADCDRRLISQAVTNLLKNAAEAINTDKDSDISGHILVSVQESADDKVTIEVEDNGIGLPVENRQRLLEPYMTTRTKGTGLGLAIVSKIMDDHSGLVELLDGAGSIEGRRGAIVRLVFPRKQTQQIPMQDQQALADKAGV